MKILFISMHSIHVIRWIENLKDTSFELYWYDVLGLGSLDTLPKVIQITDWKKRKFPPIKGEYFLSKKMPQLHQLVRPLLEVTENEALEKILEQVKPDVVHSFEMQSCSYPILNSMKKYPDIKWIYSCWGNDLFYYQHFESHLSKIKNVLGRVDYLHTDCKRDFKLAEKLGFEGMHAGVIPGGTGYKLNDFSRYKLPVSERKVILVKGYQHKFGRALNVVKALQQLTEETKLYQVTIFGAHSSVKEYISQKKLPFIVYDRHALSQEQLMQLMGKSLIYIGNNISDGMPNTLLEAIVMGAFPIQSNPGNVTAEIIEDGVNGLLIDEPENVAHIAAQVETALNGKEMIFAAYPMNEKIAAERLDYSVNRDKVISLYERLSCE